MKLKLFVFLFSVVLVSCKSENESKSQAEVEVNYLEESAEDFDKRMAWWRDAKFGMFVHWGVYAVPAGVHEGTEVKGIGEWIQRRGQIPVERYEEYAKQFNPVDFNADEWAKLMKDAGMKYLVITSKHHDGFAIWDSKVSDYDIVDFAPYGKDALKALSEACKKYGIKFGLYHSILDWHHPDAHRYAYIKDDPNKREDNTAHFADYYENYMKVQLKELIDNYDPDIMWFDGEWEKDFTHEQGLELYQYVRSLKPSILINNRVDKGRRGMQGMNKEDGEFAGDFGTPEQEILEHASTLDWESCMTMNDTWGFKKNDHNWKSTKTLVYNLIDVVAKGGNYLLNVGPTAEGIIPQPSVERLTQMGEWLKVNGEGIYNVVQVNGSYKQGETIRFTKTKTDNTIYAFLIEKPENTVTIKGYSVEKNATISILGSEVALQWEINSSNELEITIPDEILNEWNEESLPKTITFKGTEL